MYTYKCVYVCVYIPTYIYTQELKYKDVFSFRLRGNVSYITNIQNLLESGISLQFASLSHGINLSQNAPRQTVIKTTNMYTCYVCMFGTM